MVLNPFIVYIVSLLMSERAWLWLLTPRELMEEFLAQVRIIQNIEVE